jgi:hypothetical protein
VTTAAPQGRALTRSAKMSDDEIRRMAGSVDTIPTTAAGVSTDTGPAPELAMKGEARTSADRDRAAFEVRPQRSRPRAAPSPRIDG